MKVAAYSDMGGRSNNEDAYLIKTDGNRLLLCVADGLGGVEAGELASAEAKNTLEAAFVAAQETFDLSAAVESANTAILSLQQRTGKQMKTTVAAVYIDGDTVTCSHVGDSRIYLFAESGIRYQSVDHSVSQMAVMMGKITVDEIRSHEDRNLLTKTLGSSESCFPETAVFPLRELKAVLLCSDGFWEYVLEDEMRKTLSECGGEAHDWLAEMRSLVRERASADGDNHTAVAAIF